MTLYKRPRKKNILIIGPQIKGVFVYLLGEVPLVRSSMGQSTYGLLDQRVTVGLRGALRFPVVSPIKKVARSLPTFIKGSLIGHSEESTSGNGKTQLHISSCMF